MITMLLFSLLSYILTVNSSKKSGSNNFDFLIENSSSRYKNSAESRHTMPPSIIEWDLLQTPKRFTITSISVEHNLDSKWYLPSFHQKYSAGWNRTTSLGFLMRPFSCQVRFFGVGLETTLKDFKKGGTGFFEASFVTENNVKWIGVSRNETSKVHCYYMTSKHYGSDFIDTPKTLGLVIYCPIITDMEIGQYNFWEYMQSGYFCRHRAEKSLQLTVTLRNSSFTVQSNDVEVFDHPNSVITSTITTTPAAQRRFHVLNGHIPDKKRRTQVAPREKGLGLMLAGGSQRRHAVCAVQTFRNPLSGPMMNLFVRYYLSMGWRVIVYDRFGVHREYVRGLLGIAGFDYYPYTVYQLAQPDKYNASRLSEKDFNFKTFYELEKRWGYTAELVKDTADQDHDKTRTYDHCRVEYSHLDTVLFVDTDELFFCPEVEAGVEAQRIAQRSLMDRFVSIGIQEMRFVRLPYSGRLLPWMSVKATGEDAVNVTTDCMQKAYASGRLANLLSCWSSASSWDDFTKSADMAGVCPFHYNHWSCDGQRAGGRDAGKDTPRCRCKVAFDMMNGYSFRPHVNKCHLMHLNDNKYRFQSKRLKKKDKSNYDNGDVTQLNPAVQLLFSKQTQTQS